MRQLHLFAAFLLCAAGPAQQAQTPHDAGLKACTLLTQADVQAVSGAKAGPPQSTAREPHVCSYSAGPYGNVDLVAAPTRPGESADDLLKSTQAHMRMEEVKGIGDRSILTIPGPGMTQLNTYKGPIHLCLTVQIANTSPARQRATAEQLMRKMLSRLP